MKNGEIIKKAYFVYHDGLLSDDYSYNEYVIKNSEIGYGDTASEAKVVGLGLDRGSLDREVLFTDLRTRRNKSEDIVFFEGKEVRRLMFEYKMKSRERLEKLKALPDDEMYYVQDSRSYVGNAVLWWAINGAGYVTDPKKAHKYTKSEIISDFGEGRETDIVWPAGHVESAVREFVDIQGLNREKSV